MRTEYKIPIITIILAVLNVLVYFYIEMKGSSYDSEFMIQMGAIYEPLVVENHEYYRLITHFFLHFGFDHLINNMVSLLVLGYALENVIGRTRYAVIYFLSGILAGVSSIVYNVFVTGEYTVSCGASGAIYGLMGALLVLLIWGNRGHRSSEVPRYLVFIGLSLYSGIQDTSIDNAAHIGGFIAGILICLIMTRKKRMEVSYES
ncbi:MAG TPA: rhomboid family intramembrane serine protease [Lachnospiraceae bacterium]|nr:rhomboid family intramembrane serine protease [Lachnospiraceae bacterium]